MNKQITISIPEHCYNDFLNLCKGITVTSNDKINFVDLGLPSGTKWADRNVGASEIEDFGNYYDFNEAQQFNCPSLEQIKELLKYCTWNWIKFHGVKGYLVTSKIDTQYIFLPAAGFRYGSTLSDAGSYGDYWSATLRADYVQCAYYLGFSSDDRGWYYDRRYFGQAVRPVSN